MLTSEATRLFALFETLSLLFLHSQEWFVRFAYGIRGLLMLADSLQKSQHLLLYKVTTSTALHDKYNALKPTAILPPYPCPYVYTYNCP
ncbi:hypothetical protein M404DRAFT_1007513 [Pisolithus tinctorius Marx 270]|uniref:Uncharacterized protein n=1 Tax=Pisolithus tinctorius Marx 270 TaxID=870435 RepID=A0A0C3NJ31_PISTI|nr:hypothetical protein M404DRAFT_1007513 [Pisolithus tinctorius Marx 270]